MKGIWIVPVIVSILILGTLGFTQEAEAATFTAIQSGNWEDPATWDTALPFPTNIFPTDTVIIPSGITVTINFGSFIDNFGIITNSGTIDNPADIFNFGIITNNFGGTIDNSGTIDNTGTIDNFGSITIEADATLVIEATGSLTNEGTITLTGGSSIFSGRFSNQGTLINSGMITFTGGTGSNSGEFVNSGSLTNSGTVIGTGGSGIFSGRLVNRGNLVNECDGTITINGGSNVRTGELINDAGSITNSGTMTFNGMRFGSGNGSLNNSFGGTVTNHNTIIFNPGTATNSGILIGNPIIEDPIPCPGDGQPLDHYLGYRAKTTERTDEFVIQRVTLADQFERGFFVVRETFGFFTPVDKNDEGIFDDVTHLKAYKIKPFQDRVVTLPGKTTVQVINQFGSLIVDPGRAVLLLVPTLKDLVNEIQQPLTDSTVDHYKCYRVTVVSDDQTRGTVTLEDQFVNSDFTVGVPNSLCNPVNKNGEGIINKEKHLMCYQLDGRSVIRNIHTHDQFGPEEIDIKGPRLLCVPSEKFHLGNNLE